MCHSLTVQFLFTVVSNCFGNPDVECVKHLLFPAVKMMTFCVFLFLLYRFECSCRKTCCLYYMREICVIFGGCVSSYLQL